MNGKRLLSADNTAALAPQKPFPNQRWNGLEILVEIGRIYIFGRFWECWCHKVLSKLFYIGIKFTVDLILFKCLENIEVKISSLMSLISVHVRSYSGMHAYLFFWNFKGFCQIFRPNLEFFLEKLSKFSKFSLIMNKIASFYPAL